MFCPQCGSTQNDELKFCKSCGANLQALRQVMATREAGEKGEKFDWSKTWLAEMFMSSEDAVRHAAKIERLQGKTPEVKRRNEIKAGVITASAGIGLTIAVFTIMEGIIASGAVSAAAIAILSRVWIAGLIPIFVGTALIINGMFVSKRGDIHEDGPGAKELSESGSDQYLPAADTNELGREVFSVTDETTKHLNVRR